MFKSKEKKLIYSLVLAAFLLLLASVVPSLRSPIFSILKQPLNLLTLLKREAGGVIFYHRNLALGERLKKEADFLRQQLNTLNEVKLENSRLKLLLSLKQQASYKVIAARVIARAPDSWSSAVIIDKGSFNGIKRGMTAINYLGIVGRVVEAQSGTSKIILISDPNLGISSIVQRSRQEGLVCGTLGAYLMMRYLPEAADINISDTIVTSGLSENCPKGLLIGTVVAIGREFSGLSRYAIVKPAVNLSNIEEVLVIVQ